MFVVHVSRGICLLIATYIFAPRGESIADIASSSPASERCQQGCDEGFQRGSNTNTTSAFIPSARHTPSSYVRGSDATLLSVNSDASERRGWLAYLCRKGATPLVNIAVSIPLM
ncbi:hypothetical protein CBL_05331 [Carabus blaptoides fortunei]